MKKKKGILWVAVILTVVFIFGQSFLDQKASTKESTTIKEQVVEPIHEAITGEKTVRYNVRDVAHSVEFAVLGLELALLPYGRRLVLRGLRAVNGCGIVALLDESIQFLTDRAPEVSDIWRDFLGAAIGAAVAVLLTLLVRLPARRRSR